jgi:hypothetical protein
MCGYYLNVTSDNLVLMSGYVTDANKTIRGETLLSRILPLTDILLKESLYDNGSIHFQELRDTITEVLVV